MANPDAPTYTLTSQHTAAGTTHNITLPAGIDESKWLVLHVVGEATGTSSAPTAPSDWTDFSGASAGSSGGVITATFVKQGRVADASATVQVTTPVSTGLTAIVAVVSNCSDITYSGGATQTSGTQVWSSATVFDNDVVLMDFADWRWLSTAPVVSVYNRVGGATNDIEQQWAHSTETLGTAIQATSQNGTKQEGVFTFDQSINSDNKYASNIVLWPCGTTTCSVNCIGTTSGTTSAGFSHNIPLPNVGTADDVVLVAWATEADGPDSPWPAGWNTLYGHDILEGASIGDGRFRVAWKKTNDTSITVTIPESRQIAYTTHKFENASVGAYSLLARNQSSSPLAATPAFSSGPLYQVNTTAWLKPGATPTLTDYPVDYDLHQENAETSDVGLGTALIRLCSNDTPTAWTLSGNADWVAVAIVIGTNCSATPLTLTPVAGNYVINGSPQDVDVNSVLVPAAGAYALTGQTVPQHIEYVLSPAAAGEYIVDGQDTPINADLYLTPAAAGSYLVGGQTTPVGVGDHLTPEAGIYLITGQTTPATTDKLLTPAAGVYAYSGQTTPVQGGQILTPAAGVYTLTGQDAPTTAVLSMVPEAGSYVIGGQDTPLQGGNVLTPVAGVYNVTGQTTPIDASLHVTPVAGVYTISGQTLDIGDGLTLTPVAGVYNVTGQTTSIPADYVITPDAGEYLVTGQATPLTLSTATEFTLTPVAGSYLVTGQNFSSDELTKALTLTYYYGQYVTSGQEMDFIPPATGETPCPKHFKGCCSQSCDICEDDFTRASYPENPVTGNWTVRTTGAEWEIISPGYLSNIIEGNLITTCRQGPGPDSNNYATRTTFNLVGSGPWKFICRYADESDYDHIEFIYEPPSGPFSGGVRPWFYKNGSLVLDPDDYPQGAYWTWNGSSYGGLGGVDGTVSVCYSTFEWTASWSTGSNTSYVIGDCCATTDCCTQAVPPTSLPAGWGIVGFRKGIFDNFDYDVHFESDQRCNRCTCVCFDGVNRQCMPEQMELTLTPVTPYADYGCPSPPPTMTLTLYQTTEPTVPDPSLAPTDFPAAPTKDVWFSDWMQDPEQGRHGWFKLYCYGDGSFELKWLNYPDGAGTSDVHYSDVLIDWVSGGRNGPNGGSIPSILSCDPLYMKFSNLIKQSLDYGGSAEIPWCSPCDTSSNCWWALEYEVEVTPKVC